jgi:arylsulfatase A-like enzyme
MVLRLASTLPWLIACCLVLAACGKNPKRPNVLLVTLDTTRADFLSCYGAPAGATPALDALAARGVRCADAYVSASVTPVSHATIMTGRDNPEHGLRVLSGLSGYSLPENVPTLATTLKQAGWNTAAIHSAFPVSGYFGFQRGFDRFESFDGVLKTSLAGTMSWDLQKLQRRSDETTSLVLDELARDQRPFFLWIHYWDPHDPVKLPPAEDLPANLPRDPRGLLLPSRELYAAEVSYVDKQFERVLQDLEERGELEDTIIVVVADHGEGLGDHGWDYHRILYQEQVHTPLILAGPGVPRAVIEATVRSADIAPTIWDLVGVPQPEGGSGRSLRPLWTGEETSGRSAYMDQINGYDLNAKMVESRPQDAFLYAVVDAGWKLVWRPHMPDASELFDLRADPREARNLYSAQPAQVVRLQKLLAARGGFVTAPFPPQSGGDAAAVREALAGLGYAGGASAYLDARWAWFCPEHPEAREAEPLPCRRCGAPLLLVAK